MKDWDQYEPAADLFHDRVILVTGATAGIGQAVARALVRNGATVVIHGRDATALETLYDELKDLGPEPIAAQLDLEHAQGDEYLHLAQQIESRFKRLDGLLHNAGILGDLSPIEHYDVGLWQRVMHTNLNAPFILTRCLLPLLRRSEDASVLFTTSGVGNVGRAYWGAYCVSKFGTEGLAQILADECENTSIRVNCINPGSTRTRMRRQAFPAEDPSSLPTPESITGPYLYLLGPDSRGISGERIDCRPASQSTR
ncbi:MAG: YciK family oxidoreductase [Gammaproteobacteria bacterium]|nr:YciK family oxidoreductase [Gammaproteobacteria bacterium]